MIEINTKWKCGYCGAVTIPAEIDSYDIGETVIRVTLKNPSQVCDCCKHDEWKIGLENWVNSMLFSFEDEDDNE